MILYCSSTENEFLSEYGGSKRHFREKICKDIYEGTFQTLEKKIPALTYVAHLSGDILNVIYYGSSLQNSLTPHFQGLIASCFDKTLRKAWFLFLSTSGP